MEPEPVEAPDDPRLAPFRELHGRPPGGPVIAEGTLVVRRLLDAPRFRVRAVLGTPAALEALGAALAAGDVPVYRAPPAVLRSVAGFSFHRGCVALGDERVPVRLDDLLAPAPPGGGLLVGLERVGDADNVGAVIRAAHAFGAHGVLLSPGCGDPWSPKAIRVSMGAAFEVPIARVADWPAALARLATADWTLVALAPHGAVDVAAFGTRRPVPSRAVLVCGSEHDGLGAAALAAAPLVVRIPLAHGVDSLNVATAVAIALHRLAGGRVAIGPPDR